MKKESLHGPARIFWPRWPLWVDKQAEWSSESSRSVQFGGKRFDLNRVKLCANSKKSNAGRKPYDSIFMFKILVLQSLYKFSDDQTELQIKGRLSFMRFLGSDFEDRVPDAKTLWLFRDTLSKKIPSISCSVDSIGTSITKVCLHIKGNS